MKKLFIVFLLLQVGLFAQLNNTNFNIMRGDATTLTFASKYNLTGDSLIFVVKASKDITAVRLIQKTSYDNQITVSTGTKSFLYIKLLSDDTDDLTLAKYYYDITRIKNGDTTTIFIGELNLQPDIGTPFDGTDVTGRVTTVSLANGTTDRELVWWNDSLEYWQPSGVTFSAGGSVGNADSLGGIPASSYLTSLPDSAVFTSELTPYVDKSSTQTITGQKNFSGLLTLTDSSGVILYLTNPTQSPYGNFNLTTNNFWVNTAPRPDNVVRLGFNITAGGGQEIAGYGAFADEWESYFDGNGYPAFERHIAFTDSAGNIKRPITITGNPSTGAIGLGFQSGYMVFRTEDGTVYMFGDSTYWEFLNAFSFIHPNNSVSTKWYNADSSSVYGAPYIDNLNRYNLGGNINTISTVGQVLFLDSTRLVLDYNYPLVSYDSTGTERNILNYYEGVLRLASANKDKIYLKTESLFYEDTTGYLTNIINPVLPFDTSGLDICQRYVDLKTGMIRQILGTDLVTNGTFTDWTGSSKSAIPDGWEFSLRDTTSNYVEQNPTGEAHIVMLDTSGSQFYINGGSEGERFGYSYEVTSVTRGLVDIRAGGNLIHGYSNGASDSIIVGKYSGETTASDNSLFSITGGVNADLNLDNIKVWSLENNPQAPAYDIPVILDSLGQLANVDSSVINDLIGTYIDTMASDTSDYTLAEIDKVVKNATISRYDISNPTVADTFMIFWADDSLEVDSIKCWADDSTTIQIIMDETNMLSSAYLIDDGVSSTITTISEGTLLATKKARLYFTALGDNVKKVHLKIYWRYL